MPTASEYRRMAARSRAMAARLTQRSVDVARWPLSEHLSAGPVADACADALDAAARELAGAATELRSVATECERRAHVCDEHHRRLREYRELDPAIRTLLPPPVRPHVWVD
jgi:hypothetical protein